MSGKLWMIKKIKIAEHENDNERMKDDLLQ